MKIILLEYPSAERDIIDLGRVKFPGKLRFGTGKLIEEQHESIELGVRIEEPVECPNGVVLHGIFPYARCESTKVVSFSVDYFTVHGDLPLLNPIL